MELVKAGRDDVASVEALYRRIIDQTPGIESAARWRYGLHPTDDMIEAFVEQGSMYFLVDGVELVGAMALTREQGEDYHAIPWDLSAKDDEVAVLHILGVRPDCQGRGVAGRMIDEACQLAASWGRRALRLDALASNVPAQGLYLSHGFVCRGSQSLFAPNTGLTVFYYYERAL